LATWGNGRAWLREFGSPQRHFLEAARPADQLAIDIKTQHRPQNGPFHTAGATTTVFALCYSCAAGFESTDNFCLVLPKWHHGLQS
jgi:hypothetical protein